jgi:2-haloacid dehalogenase
VVAFYYFSETVQKGENMYQTLLLDVDGTLLDFEMSQHMALGQAFQRFGYPLTEQTRSLYNEINHALWKQYERGEVTRETVIYSRFEKLFQAIGVEEDCVAFEKIYQDLLGSGAYLLEGAMELVEYLYGKYELYIITNGVSDTQRRRLRDSGLAPFMKDFFISEELGVQKPQREYFDACLARMGSFVDKQKLLIIGDTLSSDILGGIHAGIDTCWYNPGYLPADSQIPATIEVHSFQELMELL